MLHHPERVHASSECVRQSFNLLELEHCPQSGTRLTATVAATLLSCLSYRAEICHGEQRAARQQREAQAEEGEAEVRPARVVFFYSIEQGRRKETRIADAILRVPTLCAGFDGYVVFWADAALLRLPTSARRGQSADIEVGRVEPVGRVRVHVRIEGTSDNLRRRASIGPTDFTVPGTLGRCRQRRARHI